MKTYLSYRLLIFSSTANDFMPNVVPEQDSFSYFSVRCCFSSRVTNRVDLRHLLKEDNEIAHFSPSPHWRNIFSPTSENTPFGALPRDLLICRTWGFGLPSNHPIHVPVLGFVFH